MIKLQNTGLTYSTVDPTIYDRFKSSGDAEIFEKLVMDLMLNKYSEDKELTEYVLGLPHEKQRMAVLSLVDGDNVLWSKMNSYVNDCTDKFEHIKDVVKIINQFVKDGDVEKKKFGEVITPISLVREMLDTLPKEVWSNPNLKWLDPANGAGTFPFVVIYKLMNGLKDWEPDTEKRYKHIVEKMIYVCELQSRNVFLWLCGVDPKDEYTTNTYWGSFLESGFDKHMKEVWGVEKFDIVIGNPPYQRKLNLKFLNKSMTISTKLVFVHPASWLIDEKNINSDFVNTKKLHAETLETVILFNGNPIFGIELYIPCAVTYINKNKGNNKIKVFDRLNNVEIDYDEIYQINKYSNITEYNNILLKTKAEYTLADIYNRKVGSYFVNMSRIRGHVNLKLSSMYQNDFYTTITRDAVVENIATKSVFFSFKTETEANNFIKYLKTKFCRFQLSVCKNSADLNKIDFSKIPLLDFNLELTDDDLCRLFNLTTSEFKFITDNIPDYY